MTRQYKANIKYKKSRPYYPERERRIKSNLYLTSYYQEDVDSVGDTFNIVVGPYKSLAAVKAGIKRAFESYPLANIYGDDQECYEDVEITYHVGEIDIVWKELNVH